MIDRINVRVYAVILKDRKILALHEEYVGEQLLKFPGGGMEYGEGVLDCVSRELEEELNLKLINFEHLYTQENFMQSKFSDNEQLLSIYYLAEIEDENDLIIRDACIDKTEWISLDAEENPFPLPVDKVVFDLLKKKFL